MKNKEIYMINQLSDSEIISFGGKEIDIKNIRSFSEIINESENILHKNFPSKIFKTIANINPFLYDTNDQLNSFTTMTGSPLLLFHNKLERPSNLVLLENNLKLLNIGIKQNIINILSQKGENIREILLEENKHFSNFHYNSSITKRDLSIGEATDTGKRKIIDKIDINIFFKDNEVFQESIKEILKKQKKLIEKSQKLEDYIILKNKLS